MAQRSDPQTYSIIGAAIDVHRELGFGFLEGVYQEALAIELENSGVGFCEHVDLGIDYKGERLRSAYRADFVCCQRVLVEIKAVRALSSNDEAQILNYLKASRLEIGLLLNFGAARLEHRRFIWTHRPRLPHFSS